MMHVYATEKKCYVVGVYCRYTRRLLEFTVYPDFRTAKSAQIGRLVQMKKNGERVLVTCESKV